MYRKLNLTAERVERVLRDRNAPASVVGGRVLPAFVELLLRPEGSTKVSQVKALQADIALAVGNSNIRIGQSGSHLAIQIGRDARQPVSWRALMMRFAQDVDGAGAAGSGNGSRFTSVLGLDSDGVLLLTRWTAPDVPHALISATTGGGKTILAQGIVLSLTETHRPYELGVVLIDPKGDGNNRKFAQAIGRHLLLPPAVTPNDAAIALGKLSQVLDDRARQMNPLPRIMVVVDELADLIEQGGPVILNPLTRIAQLGREAGIHLVVCTQKPSSKLIGPLLKANLPLRLVGRVTSIEDARVASGIAGSGAEKLSGGGDFVAVAGGRTIRFQAALIDLDAVRAETLVSVPAVSLPVALPAALPTAPPAWPPLPQPTPPATLSTDVLEDLACMRRLADEMGAVPGVTTWAAERFKARGWGVAYAGDRCKWMKPRWEHAYSIVDREWRSRYAPSLDKR